jgi:hypothetical protein
MKSQMAAIIQESKQFAARLERTPVKELRGNDFNLECWQLYFHQVPQ